MKRKMVIVALLAALAALPVGAQTFAEYEEGFQDFADGVASALPLNAAVGLNWSDAYIGNFPHFGVGVAVGAATMPWDSFEKVEDMLATDIAGEYPALQDWGVPIPALAIEARVGGLLLPFDVGVKVGFLPEDSKAMLPSGVTADYLMFGADVRYALLKGGGVIPAVSIGAGYTYLKGSVAMADVLGGTTTITDVGSHVISVTDPDVTFDWQASVIDLKAQVSKSLLVLTPYAGVGASLAVAKAGGGLAAEVLVDGVSPDQDLIEEIEEALGEDFDPDEGFFVTSEATGWTFRAFGGVSVNILMLKLDLTGMYNFSSGTFGASLSGRVQF